MSKIGWKISKTKIPVWISQFCVCVIHTHIYCSKRRNLPPESKHVRLKKKKKCSLLEAEVIVCQTRLSREEIYLACKFLYAGTCIKEHASSRKVVVVVLCRLLFWLTDWQNEQVDQRYIEKGLLVACVIFSQLRLPNCLRTVLLLLCGLVLQHI